MLIYDNECQTKENKNWTKDKIELQRIHVAVFFHDCGYDCLCLGQFVFPALSFYAQISIITWSWMNESDNGRIMIRLFIWSICPPWFRK